MGNKAGKGARNGHGGKEKHAVKENKPLDGGCPSSEGLHIGSAELVKSKEKEMSFPADGEKKNEYKAPIVAAKAGGKSIRYNSKNSREDKKIKIKLFCK